MRIPHHGATPASWLKLLRALADTLAHMGTAGDVSHPIQPHPANPAPMAGPWLRGSPAGGSPMHAAEGAPGAAFAEGRA